MISQSFHFRFMVLFYILFLCVVCCQAFVLFRPTFLFAVGFCVSSQMNEWQWCYGRGELTGYHVHPLLVIQPRPHSGHPHVMLHAIHCLRCSIICRLSRESRTFEFASSLKWHAEHKTETIVVYSAH